ncbi:MAG: carbohydrate ABC transporter permease [Gammaproteobacteria bacterium]|nr:carbohydrate ABC transporter permease [Gammaproteobacteria bacterium]MDD9800810.1 carbohydrate ABC transporter permease [Gammaproteobacteria bacterium]MDD9816229.1 carbohydrate ABC transporter permease [Gammaproteobacteria bacterium]MDD9851859.1 carbohydrate ABC transporter permease [Gammaproteobacteria bacterium]MDD9870945.1 carbohydrate ABC transporter permease [Gammaproteobacteria bacterium]
MFPAPLPPKPAIRAAYQCVLWTSLALWLLPLAAIMLTSVRTAADIAAANYWSWPADTAMVENYRAIFAGTNMLRYFANSALVTLPSVAAALLLSSMASYALATFRFRADFLVYAMFIAGNFIPFQILMIPVRDFSLSLGLYNTKTGLALFHIAFQTGFCTFFLRGFIRQLPGEMLEAARADGVPEWRIYLHIVMPLILPALAALAVLEFTFIWNDFFWGLILAPDDQSRPVTVGLQALKGTYRAQWHLLSAGSIIAALPPVVCFFWLQRHFIAGLTAGATKG